jgi:hypothetical protein
MKPTRPSVLVATALLVGVVSWLVVQHEFDALPKLPLLGSLTLAVLAVAEVYLGFAVRARLRRPGDHPIEPLLVARLAVLAKASSHAGAVVVGVYGGLFVYTVTNLGHPTFTADSRASGISAIVALVLIAGALFLEFGCRVPPPPKDRTLPGSPNVQPRSPGSRR